MSCCWNIKINEGKCIFLFLKQILAQSGCKFCWPAPNKVSWRGTVATTAAVDGLLLLSYFCNDHFPLQGKLWSSISPVRKSYFSFLEHTISAPIQASFAARLLSWTVAFEIFLIEDELRGKDSFRRGLQTFPPGSYFPIGDIGHYSASCWSPPTFALFPFLCFSLHISVPIFRQNAFFERSNSLKWW